MTPIEYPFRRILFDSHLLSLSLPLTYHHVNFYLITLSFDGVMCLPQGLHLKRKILYLSNHCHGLSCFWFYIVLIYWHTFLV